MCLYLIYRLLWFSVEIFDQLTRGVQPCGFQFSTANIGPTNNPSWQTHDENCVFKLTLNNKNGSC